MQEKKLTFPVVTLIIFGITVMVSIASMVLSLSYHNVEPATDVTSLYEPARIAIDKNFDTPVKDVLDSRYDWIAAITSLFESYFQKEARALEYFNKTNYIPFSEGALLSAITVYCKENTGSSACAKITEYSTPASIIYDLFNENKTLLKAMMPVPDCEYNNNCDYENEMLSNQYDYEIKGAAFATNVHDIKRLMAIKRRPMLLTFPHISSLYYLPCNDSRVKNTYECSHKIVKCPRTVSNYDYCATISSSTLLKNGNFYIPQSPAIPGLLDGTISVVLEGYNDDAVPSEGINRFRTHGLPRGGFIVRGTMSAETGNTISRLLGNVDVLDFSFCPNSYFVGSWVPFEAGKEYTGLKCTNAAACDTSLLYSLVRSSASANWSEMAMEAAVSEDSYGMTVTPVIAQDGRGSAVATEITSVPHWNLDNILQPVESMRANAACGHWLLPFEYLEMALALKPGSVQALDMPVKFSADGMKRAKARNVWMEGKRYD